VTASTGVWAAIVVVGVGTFLIRFSFIYLFEYLSAVPEALERALRLVPAAVLAALVVPAVVFGDGGPAAAVDADRLFAAGVAAVVAWRTENVLATIGVGILVLLSLQLLV